MYYGITIFLYMLFFRECPIVVFFKDVGVLYIYIYICVCVCVCVYIQRLEVIST